MFFRSAFILKIEFRFNPCEGLRSSLRVRLFARQDLHGSPSASPAQPAQAPVYGVEHRRYALYRDRGPPDRLHEPAHGARREAHEHRHVVGEQEEAASQLLAVLDDQVHSAVESSHSAVVHDENRRTCTNRSRWIRRRSDVRNFTNQTSQKDTGLKWVYAKQWVESRMRERQKVLCLLMCYRKKNNWLLCGYDDS